MHEFSFIKYWKYLPKESHQSCLQRNSTNFFQVTKWLVTSKIHNAQDRLYVVHHNRGYLTSFIKLDRIKHFLWKSLLSSEKPHCYENIDGDMVRTERKLYSRKLCVKCSFWYWKSLRIAKIKYRGNFGKEKYY